MSTPFQALTRIRKQVIELRDRLPVSSGAGEQLNEFIDLLDAALAVVVKAEPEPEEEPKELVMPERFDFDAFLLDMFNPSRHMSVLS